MPHATQIPVVIPAYKPGAQLVATVDELLRIGMRHIIVVNDGSGTEFDPIFDRLQSSSAVHVTCHAVNLGKGAALKTGMNYALVHFPSSGGAVTADADGQHDSGDIFRVAEKLAQSPESLVLGVRAFSATVPLRSRIGNGATRVLLRFMLGTSLTDTQTGLRGIPYSLIPHLLRLTTSGYEFELDMLLACKYQSISVVQVPIRTIYTGNNESSHFHPIIDSMRIYFLLFRFSLLSLMTAVLDNVVFFAAFWLTGIVGYSQAVARLVATLFNYGGARTAVFHSRQQHTEVLPKYLLLVCINGMLSYALIEFLSTRFGMHVMYAKILAESILFIANFTIQRDFVFTRRRTMASTDWDQYYQHVPVTARLTRKYTASVLLEYIKRYCAATPRLSIVEFGGANSCFLDSILNEIKPRSYDIVDTNRYGLSLLAGRPDVGDVVRLREQSVLDLNLDDSADMVFSIGLVEHFDPAATRKAVLAHFDALRPDGIAIITFPTPTLLYRIARYTLEVLRLWKFPDERPLRSEEVVQAVMERGEIVAQKTLWPLILTQHLVVARKRVCAVGGGLSLTGRISPRGEHL